MKNDSPFKQIAKYQLERQQHHPFTFDQVISYTQQLRPTVAETPLLRNQSLQPQLEFMFEDSTGKCFNIYIVEQGQSEGKQLLLPKIKQSRDSSEQTQKSTQRPLQIEKQQLFQRKKQRLFTSKKQNFDYISELERIYKTKLNESTETKKPTRKNKFHLDFS